MPKSMTGYSKVQNETENISYLISIKTVNSKYLNIDIRIPETFSSMEIEIERFLRKKLKRGTVKVNIEIIFKEDIDLISLNIGLAKSYNDAFEKLKNELDISQNPSLDNFLRLRGIFNTEMSDELSNEVLAGIKSTLDNGIKKLNEDRQREGNELKIAMLDYLDKIQSNTLEIEKSASQMVAYYRDKLTKRIEELLDREVDKNRIEQEVVFFAEKADISEEVVRLKSHVKEFKKMLENETTSGIKLDFICQELNREFNTIASKSKTLEITKQAVEGKTNVNRLREQTQNIE